MTTVIDASVIAAALVDSGSSGTWAESVLSAGSLAAPHLMPVETANILKRMANAGDISSDIAALAHSQLLSLRAELFPYSPFGERVWELRGNVTAYDAWYVALAEALDAPLATLDTKLSRAPGTRCRFLIPPDPGPQVSNLT
jgi:predicted nucleic acid-binding protein